MKLKVCGMRTTQNIKDVLNLEPDYMGFIFYKKSPRDVGEELDEALLKGFPESTKKVGVFVNADLVELKHKVAQFGLDYVQLHGDESVEYVAELFAVGIKVIKVFSIGSSFEFDQLKQYRPYVDFFLFDTKGESRGGTGKTFDWEVLKKYDQKVPFFLSGGIDLENLKHLKILEGMNLHALDVNSRFELAPGLKDIEKIKELKASLRS